MVNIEMDLILLKKDDVNKKDDVIKKDDVNKNDVNKKDNVNKNDVNINRVIGTPCYIALEVWSVQSYSKANDVYSFGILLYELVYMKKHSMD